MSINNGKGNNKNKQITNDDIRKIVKGDEKSFFKIYNYYKNYVFKNCYIATFSKEEAMDLFQEIWLKIYLGIKKLKNDEKFFEWMKTIIRNTIINYEKKKGNLTTVPLEDLNLEDANNFLNQLEIKDEFERILRSCSSEERYILYLKFYEGATIKEISEVFGISQGAVKMRINRILRRLKENHENQ